MYYMCAAGGNNSLQINSGLKAGGLKVGIIAHVNCFFASIAQKCTSRSLILYPGMYVE